jgi:hypothetical protein
MAQFDKASNGDYFGHLYQARLLRRISFHPPLILLHSRSTCSKKSRCAGP